MNMQATSTRETSTVETRSPSGRVGVPWVGRAYAIAGGIFALGVLVQVFLAGGAIFSGPSWWPAHAMLGMILGVAPVILFALAFVGRLPARATWLTALLLGLTVIQSMLPTLPAKLGVPILAALHPVNALIIFALALLLALDVWTRDAR